MSRTATLFFSVSDISLYRHIEAYLPGRIPSRKFKFLGSTFASEQETRDSKFRPVSRLLNKWIFMNERTERDYAPVLLGNRYDVVFVHEFGREAVLCALKYEDEPDVLEFHKKLVAARLLAQDINPPEYISRRLTDPRLTVVDDLYFKDPKQRITYLKSDVVGDQYHEVLRLIQTRLKERDGIIVGAPNAA